MIIKHKESNTVLEHSPQIQNLVAWARNQGAYISDKLHYPCTFCPGYQGTVALSEIHPEELLISIPNSLLLSTKFSNPPELQAFFTSNPDFFSLPNREHEDYRMMAFLIWEMSKPNTSWSLYFSSLPTEVETVSEWKEKELVELQDSDFVNDAMIRKNWNSQLCKDLSAVFSKYPELFMKDLVTPQKLLWCWIIMTTRCFGGGLPYPSLIPIADFLNHTNGPTVYYYAKSADPAPDTINLSEDDLDEDLIDESDCVKLSLRKLQKINFMAIEENEENLKVAKELERVVVEFERSLVKVEKAKETPTEESEEFYFQIRTSRTERYEEGSQVCISYGNYSNRMLLTNYGFAIRENVYDYARVKLPLKVILKPEQYQRLAEKYDNPLCVAFKFKGNLINLEFLAVIRGILWETWMPVECFVQAGLLDLEEIVLFFALRTLEGYLEEFETSIEEDTECLEKALNSRMYFAV